MKIHAKATQICFWVTWFPCFRFPGALFPTYSCFPGTSVPLFPPFLSSPDYLVPWFFVYWFSHFLAPQFSVLILKIAIFKESVAIIYINEWSNYSRDIVTIILNLPTLINIIQHYLKFGYDIISTYQDILLKRTNTILSFIVFWLPMFAKSEQKKSEQCPPTDNYNSRHKPKSLPWKTNTERFRNLIVKYVY